MAICQVLPLVASKLFREITSTGSHVGGGVHVSNLVALGAIACKDASRRDGQPVARREA